MSALQDPIHVRGKQSDNLQRSGNEMPGREARVVDAGKS